VPALGNQAVTIATRPLNARHSEAAYDSDSVHLAKLRATMGAATITLAKRKAINITKEDLRAQGLRPHHMPHCQIVARANKYLLDHREELIAEAKQTVERWRVEGFFGKRAQAAVHKCS
jgi:hypothetical protein